MKPEIILRDEPFRRLTPIHDLALQLIESEAGNTIIFTHDIDEAPSWVIVSLFWEQSRPQFRISLSQRRVVLVKLINDKLRKIKVGLIQEFRKIAES